MNSPIMRSQLKYLNSINKLRENAAKKDSKKSEKSIDKRTTK